MKNFYDKLILLVAAVALAGGVMLYFQNSAEAPNLAEPVPVQPADNPYSPVPVPETPSTEAEWPEPKEQSTGWVYDVFTPPKIYIDEDGRFTAEGWEPPAPEEPFGLYLAEIKRELYRLQIQGYIEEDREDRSRTLVLLYDTERNATVRLRTGERSQASEVEMLDFSIDRQVNADEGQVEVSAEASIRDLRTDETITLVKDEILYESGVKALLRSEQLPDFEIELSEPGTTFETELGEYKLLAINLEEQSVVVEKYARDTDPDTDTDDEPEVEELILRTPSDPPEDRSRSDQTEPTENDLPF
ncbi:MAG: hypothetical protein ACLFS1_06660 [Opitutales bacterium]